MAAAPITQEDPKTEAEPAAQKPLSQTETPAQPTNPTPVAAPPLTASNAASLASESSQQSAPPPAGNVAPDGHVLTAAELSDRARAQGMGAAAAASSGAATQAGQNQQKAQAAAVNTASQQGANAATARGGKAQPPVKTALDLQAEALSKAPENIKKMLEGDDPIARREFNMLLNQVGPQNQLAMEGMAMRLKHDGLDGQGAGNALMAMLARDLQYDTDQLIAKIDADSAKRLYDLNQWGFAKAQEIAVQQEKLKRDNLELALKYGQWDMAASTWDQLFPNVPFDTSSAKAKDPMVQEAVSQQSKLVQQLIEQGNAEGAKQAFLTMARANPEMFGAKTAAEVDAMYSGLDFTKEVWSKNQAFNDQVTESIRTAALQGDRASAMSAIDRYFHNMVPGAADKLGASELGSMSLDEINAVLKANGKAPLQSEQDKVGISAEEFAKDKKYADELSAAKGANGVDLMLKQIVDIHPEIGVNPELRNAARAWLFDNVASMNVSPDGSSLAGFTFKEGAALPPWDPNSVSGHLYTDWPQATFNEDGSVQEILYKGGVPYSQEHPKGDLTTEIGKSTAQIDRNYETYVMKTRLNPEARLGRDDWFYATKGGQQVDPIPSQSKKTDGGPTTPGDSGDVSAQTLVSQIDGIGESTKSFLAWKDARGSDTITLDNGVSAKVEGIGKKNTYVADTSLVALDVGGKKVSYDPTSGHYYAKYTTPDGKPQIAWRDSVKELLTVIGENGGKTYVDGFPNQKAVD